MIISLMGPAWAYGVDVAIQFFGALIALFIAIYGYKAYKLTKDKKYLYFGSAFGLLSFNLFLFVLMIPALYIYYTYLSGVDPGMLLSVSHMLNFIYMFVTLMAYTVFVVIYAGMARRSLMLLLGSLVFALVIYSYANVSFIGFNLVALLLLAFVIGYNLKNYIKKERSSSPLVLSAFALIALGHLFFILEIFNSLFYVLGHITQLIGYVCLLVVVLRIMKHGGKKR